MRRAELLPTRDCEAGYGPVCVHDLVHAEKVTYACLASFDTKKSLSAVTLLRM